MKYAIFSCMGLGDGLIIQILAYHLKKAGHEVVTHHPFLEALQEWFPGLPFKQFPSSLPNCDRYVFVYETSESMQVLMKEALEHHRERTTILNPIATPRADYPYWEEGRFDGQLPFALNLMHYCRDILHISNATLDNGITLPRDVEKHKYKNRIVIHPTSSRLGKNWSKGKFLQLTKELKKQGYEPIFVLTDKEKGEWPEVEAPRFTDLGEVARFIAESGAMIGNDSGIGHLASCLGLPTVTICRNQMAAHFWRPYWSPGEVVVPPKWIPNLKGMRWRDKKWQAFVSTRTVLRAFGKLRILSNK